MQQIKSSDDEEKKTILLDKQDEIKEEKIEAEKEEKSIENNEYSISDSDIVEAFKGLESLSREDLLKKCKKFMVLDYQMLSNLEEQETKIKEQEAIIEEQEAIIEEQRDLIYEYESILNSTKGLK